MLHACSHWADLSWQDVISNLYLRQSILCLRLKKKKPLSHSVILLRAANQIALHPRGSLLRWAPSTFAASWCCLYVSTLLQSYNEKKTLAPCGSSDADGNQNTLTIMCWQKKKKDTLLPLGMTSPFQ